MKVNISYFVITGIYYGYPLCCINEFIENCINDTFDTHRQKKLHGTGYIPCNQCNLKAIKELKSYIAKNRSPKLMPFPDQRTKEEAA